MIWSSKQEEMVVVIYKIVDDVEDHDSDAEQEDTEAETRLDRQHTGGDTAWDRCYILTAVCLLVLCVLLLTGITVMWIEFNNLATENIQLQTRYNNLTKERDQLLTRYNTLTPKSDQLQTSYKNLTLERDQLLTMYNNLTIERDEFLWETDDYFWTFNDLEKCVWFSSSYYYMSNEKKTWDKSREDCRAKGADLVIINSKEEQEFIGKQLDRSEYWIGLSDRDEEGKWKWVDDTPLTTKNWNTEEPNNKGDEDCAEMYSYPKGNRWNDKDCSYKQPWICEKHISQ